MAGGVFVFPAGRLVDAKRGFGFGQLNVSFPKFFIGPVADISPQQVTAVRSRVRLSSDRDFAFGSEHSSTSNALRFSPRSRGKWRHPFPHGLDCGKE